MRVEIVGGPDDGKVFDLPDGADRLRVPRLDGDPFRACRAEEVPPDGLVSFRVLDVPVLPRTDGSFIALWPRREG